jgi:hypothetical protein
VILDEPEFLADRENAEIALICEGRNDPCLEETSILTGPRVTSIGYLS